ncbi:angiopoietin-4-like [Sphaeramia orbicularis]|uniref:angiopoietin-4-like n=1 Tax=Sphaeramia orbicularis TaxID=375764 RepID=UPI00117D1D53|nr:angiopoietin-4-like [Sphaeramia orbicularis]
MSKMKLQCVFLAVVLLISVSAPNERPDFGHNDDVHPNVFMDVPDVHSNMDVPDTNTETNWDVQDINKDNYEDADWHPPPSFPDTSDLPPDDPPPIRSSADQTRNNDSSTSLCGEYGGQVTSDGRCRLVAALPPTGMPQKRCPDIFRCTDDISYWLRENQEGRDQLEELKETMSDLQEELRMHQHRIQALETQSEDGVTLNATFAHRLRSLETRHAQADTLLHVHAALLYELQAQLRNLSAAVRHVSRNSDCKVNVVRTPPPPLSMRDKLLPDRHFLSFCPSDCASLYQNGVRRSGVYTIVLSPGTPLPVYCDMDTEGGGWTVFQRRRDGSVSFNRGWTDYRDGFGEARGEHWLGNHQLHLLSNQGHYSLRIHLQDWGHAHRHAHYSSFRIEDEENRYRLHVSGFSGTVEDSFGWYHNLQDFSTPDTGDICAEISHAGWWFHQCFYANLNGVYYQGGQYSLKAQNLLGPDGIVWFSWKDSDFYSLKAVSMMVRPNNFRPRLSP